MAALVTRVTQKGDHVTVKLTSLAVRHAKPRLDHYGAPRRTEYPDGGSGLYLTVQPRGAKSFTLRYRINGRSRNLRLGSAAASEAEARDGALTLAAARLRAAEARLQSSATSCCQGGACAQFTQSNAAT